MFSVVEQFEQFYSTVLTPQRDHQMPFSSEEKVKRCWERATRLKPTRSTHDMNYSLRGKDEAKPDEHHGGEPTSGPPGSSPLARLPPQAHSGSGSKRVRLSFNHSGSAFQTAPLRMRENRGRARVRRTGGSSILFANGSVSSSGFSRCMSTFNQNLPIMSSCDAVNSCLWLELFACV